MRKKHIAGALAVLYALSFAFLCLGTCFAMSSTDDASHGCCPKPDTSVSAPSRDCCAITAAEFSPVALAVVDSPVVGTWDLPQTLTPCTSHAALPHAAASPPSVLRI